MKANELRIGNFVETNYEGILEVANINSEYSFIECRKPLYKAIGRFIEWDIKPIFLTEKWLLEFGFEKVEDINKDTCPDYKIKGMLIHSDVHGNYVLGNYSPICLINNVHQLQNLYFALTGQELEIKE